MRATIQRHGTPQQLADFDAASQAVQRPPTQAHQLAYPSPASLCPPHLILPPQGAHHPPLPGHRLPPNHTYHHRHVPPEAHAMPQAPVAQPPLPPPAALPSANAPATRRQPKKQSDAQIRAALANSGAAASASSAGRAVGSTNYSIASLELLAKLTLERLPKGGDDWRSLTDVYNHTTGEKRKMDALRIRWEKVSTMYTFWVWPLLIALMSDGAREAADRRAGDARAYP
jgi:hypothetical protein